MSVTLQEAAQRRAADAAARGASTERPGAARRDAPAGVTTREAPPIRTELRTAAVERDGKSYLKLDGYASVYERGYEMWDFFGPYTEVVSARAGSESLGSGPDVNFLINHTGMPLASTRGGTLELSEDETGLRSVSFMNPLRQAASDLYMAIQDGDVREMSFAFTIDRGQWSPDYTEYRIDAYGIHRGDTSAVTFGANPYTSIAARFALTNNVMRAAKVLDSEERSLLGEALGLGAEEVARSAAGRPTLTIGERAGKDLRHLRASLAEGSNVDALARRSLVALLDDVLTGQSRLAGDGPLAVLLGVAEAPERAAAPSFAPSSVEFLEQELAAARSLGEL